MTTPAPPRRRTGRPAMFAEAWTFLRGITVLDVLDILLIAFMIY